MRRRLATTTSARLSAAALGFDAAGVVRVVASAERQHFYKSMTSYDDHRRWQDVYHVPVDGLLIYLKFTDDILTEFRVLSFKER